MSLYCSSVIIGDLKQYFKVKHTETFCYLLFARKLLANKYPGENKRKYLFLIAILQHAVYCCPFLPLDLDCTNNKNTLTGALLGGTLQTTAWKNYFLKKTF